MALVTEEMPDVISIVEYWRNDEVIKLISIPGYPNNIPLFCKTHILGGNSSYIAQSLECSFLKITVHRKKIYSTQTLRQFHGFQFL